MCDVYFDLTNDDIFKMVFAKEESAERLRGLLNVLLRYEGDEQITAVEILNPIQNRSDLKEKKPVLDLYVKDGNGRHYNIEMQVKVPEEYPKRALYYASKLYGSQMIRGDEYDQLQKTVSISLLKNNFFDCEELHNVFRFRNDRDGSLLNDDLIDMHFFEVGKFNKDNPDELKDIYEGWLHVFRYGERILSGDIVLSERLLSVPGIKEAVDIMRFANEDDETRVLLISREKQRRKEEGLKALKTAEKRRIREEGSHERARQIAKKLLSKMDDEEIATDTGLSVEEVAKLRAEMEAQEPAD